MSRHTMSMTAAQRQGFRAETWTGAELVKALGDEFAVYESFGHVHGTEQFARQNMRLAGDRLEVVCDPGNGRPGWVVLTNPLDRPLRILVK